MQLFYLNDIPKFELKGCESSVYDETYTFLLYSSMSETVDYINEYKKDMRVCKIKELQRYYYENDLAGYCSLVCNIDPEIITAAKQNEILLLPNLYENEDILQIYFKDVICTEIKLGNLKTWIGVAICDGHDYKFKSKKSTIHFIKNIVSDMSVKGPNNYYKLDIESTTENDTIFNINDTFDY